MMPETTTDGARNCVRSSPTSANQSSVTHQKSRLLNKIDRTSGARFSAARRMEWHDSATQWTVAVMACCVIGLNLLDGLEMLVPKAHDLVVFLQVFCGVCVVAFSIIQSKGNFALRAYRHHECGKAIKRLESRVSMVDDDKHNEIERLYRLYYATLDKYDNHEDLDLDFTLLQQAKYAKVKQGQRDEQFEKRYRLRAIWEYKLYVSSCAIALIGLVFLFWVYKLP